MDTRKKTYFWESRVFTFFNKFQKLDRPYTNVLRFEGRYDGIQQQCTEDIKYQLKYQNNTFKNMKNNKLLNFYSIHAIIKRSHINQ